MVDNSVRSKENPNPFSFKSFLKSNQSIDASPIRKHNEDAENPFSFRKFLNQEKSPESSRTYQNSDVIVISLNDKDSCNYSDSDLESKNEFHSDIDSAELPDFIQDHLEFKSENKTDNSLQLSNSEEHSSVDQASNITYEKIIYSSVTSNSEGEIAGENSIYHNDFELESKNILAEHTSYNSLPDFISGTQQSDNTWSSSQSYKESDETVNTHSFDDEVYRLREENAVLHKQLEKISRTSDIQASRIVELEKKLNDLSDKEAQETDALEKMVQQVECNLQITTERAVKAENQVTKLKQEIKSLQGLLKNVMKENEKLNNVRHITEVDSITEKANYLSSQIKTAADNAEQPLRALLEGLEHLRLLSSLTANIGKVQDDTN